MPDTFFKTEEGCGRIQINSGSSSVTFARRTRNANSSATAVTCEIYRSITCIVKSSATFLSTTCDCHTATAQIFFNCRCVKPSICFNYFPSVVLPIRTAKSLHVKVA